MNSSPPQAEPGIDQKTLNEKLGFTPHTPAQSEYVYSTTRFNVPCCGRRWGKSISAGRRMTYKSFVPDSYNWIIGPTYKLGEKEFRVVFRDYEKLGILKYCRKSYSAKQGDMRIKTPWNSVVEVVSAEKPDSLLGEGLSHAIMSEAAKHNRATWEQYVEPALTDLLGSCDFPSTPQGYNWYHGLHLMGQEARNPHYKSWSFPTWTNPVRYPGGINNAEIDRIRQIVSKTYFDQEYGAKFTSFAGAIYEEWDERKHVQLHEFNPDWPNYLAFDYGFANPFVCLDIQVSPSDDVFVWREYYVRHKTNFEHAQVLKKRDNPENYRIDALWGDHADPDAAATIALVLGFVGSMDIPWKHGVEEIKRLLKPQRDGVPKLHISPNCPNLIRQMQQLHIKKAASRTQFTQDIRENVGDGNIQHKVDDHAADALRYFIGPHFVAGAGSHLVDVYGEDYTGSESEDFLILHNNVTLDEDWAIGF